MPAIYIFVYYNAGLYADFGINIYYLGACHIWVDDVEIRSILTPDNPEKENPGYGKPTTRAFP